MSKPSKPQRPKITEDHRLFGARMAAAANSLAETSVARIEEHCGPFPNDLDHQFMLGSFLGYTSFIDNAPPFEGSIDGGDSFSFVKLSVAHEALDQADGDETLNYFGGSLGLNVHFGSKKWAARLYGGQGTPPILIDDIAANRYDLEYGTNEAHLSSQSVYVEKLAENELYFPEGPEIRLIAGALAVAADRVDIASNLEEVYVDLKTGNEPSAAWFGRAMNIMRDVQ